MTVGKGPQGVGVAGLAGAENGDLAATVKQAGQHGEYPVDALLFHQPADEAEQDGACLVIHETHEQATSLKTIYADSAYNRKGLPKWVRQTLGIQIEIVRKIARGFEVLPKRWIVERTFAWLNHDRRLSKDFERRTDSAEAMIHLGQIRRMLTRLTVN